MSMALDLFCFMMPVIIPQAVLLFICMIVGGCVYSILCNNLLDSCDIIVLLLAMLNLVSGVLSSCCSLVNWVKNNAWTRLNPLYLPVFMVWTPWKWVSGKYRRVNWLKITHTYYFCSIDLVFLRKIGLDVTHIFQIIIYNMLKINQIYLASMSSFEFIHLAVVQLM